MICREHKTAVSFLMAFVCVSEFICGCNQDKQPRKLQTNYSQTEADSLFDKGAGQPPSLQTLYVIADILVAQGRDDQAEVLLERILREHPQFTPAYNNMAEIKMRKRRIDEAVKILSKGLEVDPRDPVLLNNLGMCWMIKQRYDKALEFFTEAAGVKPQNTKYRANMAVSLAFLGRDEEALALYRQILPEKQAVRNLETVRAARNAKVK